MRKHNRKLKKKYLAITALICICVYLVNGVVFDEICAGVYTNSSFYRSMYDEYGVPLGELCVGWAYRIYLNLSLFNATIFLIQYVPMTVYMYKTIRNIYRASRARVKQKRMELMDIEKEIEAVKSKLLERDQEFMERSEKLRREAERLRRVRARVREIISTDELLRQTFEAGIPCDVDSDLQSLPDEEHEYVMQILKQLHYNQNSASKNSDDCSDVCHSVHSETSIYSSISGDNIKQQDCRVKVVKVTNVYKIAYLKHFIKQKRLRRANKQAVLKKKMEGIKKQLENWQKTLNMVINNQLSIFNIDSHPIDVVSQEAMGDYSKPSDFRPPSDSDSDLRDSENDSLYDDYCTRWTQSSPGSKPQFIAKDADATLAEYNDNLDIIEMDYQSPRVEYNDARLSRCHLTPLPEETRSQLAIEENDDSGRRT